MARTAPLFAFVTAATLATSAVALSACGSAPPPEPVRPPSAVAEEPVAPPKRAVPAGELRREDVLAVLSDGPPAFLARVDVEPSKDRAGKFHGWRVVAMKDAAWADVHPGDVILRVNGKKIDDPFQFFDVFQSLAFATSLAITVEREGAPVELRWPINDDPAAPPPPRPEKSADHEEHRPGEAPDRSAPRTSKSPGKAKKLHED